LGESAIAALAVWRIFGKYDEVEKSGEEAGDEIGVGLFGPR
jgi:hypothetical protein